MQKKKKKAVRIVAKEAYCSTLLPLLNLSKLVDICNLNLGKCIAELTISCQNRLIYQSCRMSKFIITTHALSTPCHHIARITSH